MFVTVWPIRTFIFYGLFLLATIFIESFSLKRSLGIGCKTTIQISAYLNLVSNACDWLLFFTIQLLLPESLRLQLLNYILFGHFYQNTIPVWLQAFLYIFNLVLYKSLIDSLLELIALKIMLVSFQTINKKFGYLELPEYQNTFGTIADNYRDYNIEKYKSFLWSNLLSNSLIFLSGLGSLLR